MVDGHLFHARNVEFAVIGWRDLMRAVGSVLRLDRHRPKMASVCIEQPRFASAHIDIHSDAVGQVVPALKEMLLIVFLPVASSSGPLFWAIISRRGTDRFAVFVSVRTVLPQRLPRSPRSLEMSGKSVLSAPLAPGGADLIALSAQFSVTMRGCGGKVGPFPTLQVPGSDGTAPGSCSPDCS